MPRSATTRRRLDEHEAAAFEQRLHEAAADYVLRTDQALDAMRVRDRIVVEAVEAGMSTTAAARAAGCSQATVMRILARV